MCYVISGSDFYLRVDELITSSLICLPQLAGYDYIGDSVIDVQRFQPHDLALYKLPILSSRTNLLPFSFSVLLLVLSVLLLLSFFHFSS